MTLIRDDFRACLARLLARFCTDEGCPAARRCCARLAVATRPTNRCPPSRSMCVMAAVSDMMPTLQRASTNESDPPEPRMQVLNKKNDLEV